MTKKSDNIRIGTSGWSYKHWVGPFYPPELSPRDHLAHYTSNFDTVELNTSFYHLPAESAVAHWRDRTPPGFLFAVKASRYITHVKRLADPAPSVEKFLARMTPLGEKLGPILFQLPPRWKFNEERFAGFLEALPAGLRFAFEFRDPDWLNPRVFEMLEARNHALCIYELNGFQSPIEATADFVYVRLHGPGGKYAGLYGGEGLRPWAERIKRWSGREKRDVYCYFDNDEKAYAAADAALLREMLGASRSRRTNIPAESPRPKSRPKSRPDSRPGPPTHS